VRQDSAEQVVLEDLIDQRHKLGVDCGDLMGWLCRKDKEPRGVREEATYTWPCTVLDHDETLELLVETVIDVEHDFTLKTKRELEDASKSKHEARLARLAHFREQAQPLEVRI
jgi:hypothetical protein